MKVLSTVLLVFAAGAAHAQAQNQSVFVCVNADGTREYKNTGTTKGCKPVDLQGVSMITAPPRRVGPASASQPGSAKAATSPAGFPRVDDSTQKQRDTDRMHILSDELKAEEKKLATLRQDFNNGEPERRGDERNYAKYQERVANMKDDIARVERNVEALRRELANSK